MNIKYTTKGQVRRFCGHKHKSIDTAFKCMVKDQNMCRNLGGYSDRTVVRIIDDEIHDLTETEFEDFVNLEYQYA